MAGDLYQYRATLIPWNDTGTAWHDGDTFNADVDLGCRVHWQGHVRCAGYNAPEVTGASKAAGLEAAAYVRTLLDTGAVVHLDSHAFQPDELDNFGRMLATVTLPDGRDLAALMIGTGHAVPDPPLGATVTYTLKIRRYDNADPRLGRHVLHDSRSLAYQVAAKDPRTLTSVRHHTNIPTLDQGNLGSCTGNAATGALGTDGFWGAGSGVLSTVDALTDEAYAVGVYSDATKLDPWPGTYPPSDTGSDGLSVAKVLKNRGLISGYQHATSLNAALTALADGPVLIGSDWHQDMFNPDADGRLHITGAIAGGHEYILDELDVTNQRVWMHNSWGESWGVQGRAYLTWADLGALLGKDGDCTVLVPVTQPAPTPTPAPPPLPPEPVDPTAPVVPQALADALDRFTVTKSCPDYLRTAWVDTKEK